MLWVAPEHIDMVTAGIWAHIPRINEQSSQYDKAVYNLVMAKQQHKHRPNGCMAEGQCRYGFPFKVHPEQQASCNPTSHKWEYHRPTEADCMTIPYHALILAIWGAHMNMQRVTGTDWSFYLLKYTMKSECTGKLDMDTSTLERLGLSHLPQAELHMLNTMLLAKPVAPAEAYCIVKEHAIVQFKSKVVSVNTSPPGQRCFGKRSSALLTHSTQTYMQRPDDMDHLSFKQFYKDHLVLPAKEKPPERAVYVCTIGTKKVYQVEDLIVRFTNFHPAHHTEAFCYNLLLDQVPFKNDTDLTSAQGNQATKSFYYIVFGTPHFRK